MKSSPEITNGVTTAIRIVINQLSKIAILSPFSVMISAMYNHGIGPRENSKRTTNKRMKITQNT